MVEDESGFFMEFPAEDQKLSFQTVREGVFAFEEKPIYILDLIDEFTEPYILAFGIQDPLSLKQDPRDYEHLVKANHKEEIAPPVEFKLSTELGRIASHRTASKRQVRHVTVTNPPIFLSPVIEGTDTFTGGVGPGFNERTPDRPKKEGEPTGVFICLSNVLWLKTFIPKQSFVEYFTQKKENYLNGGGLGSIGSLQNGF